jgi:translation initiation factor IF-2
MAENKNMKLLFVAKEINIGKDAIVQLLQSKGFNIENKPTAVLTDDMLDVIYDKFKREKKAAEKQREKIEKHKQIRKPSIRETEDMPVSRPADVVPVDEETKEKTVDLPVVEAKVVAEDIEPVEDTRAKEPQPGDKIIIDLEKFAKFSRKEPKKVEQKKSAEKADEQPPQAPVVDEKIEPEDSLQVTKAKEEKVEAEPEPIIQVSEPIIEIIAEEPSVEIKPAQAIEPDEPELAEEATTEEKQDDIEKKRKRKKRKKLAEVEFEPGQAPKLKGLTIVGKIDLAAPKESLPKKIIKTKVKSEDEDEDFIGKSKLKKKGKAKGKDKVVTVKEKVADRKKKRRKSIRDTISDEDINRAIKETLSDMDESSIISMRSKIRQKKRIEREEKEMRKIEELERQSKNLQLTEFVTTSDIAKMLNVTASEIIMKCMSLGLMVSINQRLDKDTITLIADDYGYEVEFLDEKTIQEIDDEIDAEDDLKPRAPIVTIMGHVDHGKTSLLDYIRRSNIVAGEAGGITQHIGAYRVELPNGKHITFLDTPGHEAFTAMRARGAQVTDIVVLVVSADDSVMPQTVEAISHAQAANVPIIVAINKIDKPDAKPERIKQQLADRNILVEEWGGKYQSVEISAKHGINVELLLEKILLEAEMLNLKANPNRSARATVIESNMDKGLGPVSTVIVQKGTLSVGDPFVAGIYSGRVRIMLDERNNKIESLYPSQTARIIGFEGLPEAGDILAATKSDSEARGIAIQRQKLKREQEFRKIHHVTLDDISKQIQQGAAKELYLIIKGDVGGSVEALSDSLQKLSVDEVRVIILHKGVGSITESDVMLAIASRAIIIGFQVNPTAKARKLADIEAVEIRLYNIIYDCINDVKLAMEGLLTPEMKEDIIATIEVRKVFRIGKGGMIAGCYVQSGKITRNDRLRVLRDGLPVFTGNIQSLKRNKDDVREVESGYECGIMLDGFQDIQVGDILEGFKVVEVRRTLS